MPLHVPQRNRGLAKYSYTTHRYVYKFQFSVIKSFFKEWARKNEMTKKCDGNLELFNVISVDGW